MMDVKKVTDDLKRNGFVDKTGVHVYPYQPEKHEQLTLSKIGMYRTTIYSLGILPNRELMIVILGQDGEKKGVRLPTSESLSNWGQFILSLFLNHPDMEEFPCQLEVRFDYELNDYVAILLPL